ncbi:TPA: hypothetical protein G8W59_004236 [Salmonella enterica]|uniref:Fimbrial, major and minor subunit n=1 Tax=Salmonella enterica TaxID=28901 RepID=A0A759KBS5_SALER|nr:hypothetical protein [Salmonella enterica]
MKKTLIALAVAASAAVSGSAMAWTANGNGGSIEVGGTLTPVEKVTPWEVATGAAVTNVDAQVQKTQSQVEVGVSKSIPILAIRSVNPDGFTGRIGISPQINYGWVSTNNWADSTAPASALVRDEQGTEIGRATFNIQAIGVYSAVTIEGTSPHKALMFGGEFEGIIGAFTGGLPEKASEVADVRNTIIDGWPDIQDKYIAYPGAEWASNYTTDFAGPGWKYSAYYGSVIPKNSKINLALNAPVSGDAPLKWKMNLPVSVIYQ